jgi:hypothetical protein
VATQFDVLQTSAIAQSVVGNVQDMIRLGIRQVCTFRENLALHSQL